MSAAHTSISDRIAAAWDMVCSGQTSCCSFLCSADSSPATVIRNELARLSGDNLILRANPGNEPPRAPYHPLISLLQQGLSTLNLPPEDVLSGNGVYALHRSLLVKCLQGEPIQRHEEIVNEELPYEQTRMLESISHCFSTLAHSRPLVLEVANLQSVAVSTLELLKTMVRSTSPLLLILLVDREQARRGGEGMLAWSRLASLLEELGSVQETEQTGLSRVQLSSARHEWINETDPETMISLSEKCLSLLALEECKGYASSLYRRLDENQTVLEDTLQSRLLQVLGAVHGLLGENDTSLFFYNTLLSVAQEHGNTAMIADIYRLESFLHLKKENYSSSRKLAEQSVKLADKLGDDRSRFNAYLQWALIRDRHHEASDRVIETIYYLEETVLPLAEKLAFRNTQCVIHEMLGVALGILEPHFLEQLEFYGQVDGDDEAVGKRVFYTSQNKNEKALEYYDASIEMAQELGNEFRLAASLEKKGVIYTYMNRNQEAMELFTKSIRLKTRLGNRLAIAKYLNSIGYLYFLMERFPKANRYFLRALNILKNMNDYSELAVTLFNMTQVRFYARDFHSAVFFGELTLRIINQLRMGSVPYYSLIEIRTLIALAHLKLGDNARSQEYYQLISETGNIVTKEERLYFGWLNALLARSKGNYRQSLSHFQAMQKILESREQAFFYKRYTTLFDIPFYLEYGSTLLECGKQAEGKAKLQEGIGLCRELQYPFHLALYLEQLGEGEAPENFHFDERNFDFQALLDDAAKEAEQLRQKETLDSLHKKINEINFLNNLQNILGRSYDKRKLIVDVMDLINNNLLVELAFVYLREDRDWKCFYSSRPRRDLAFDPVKLVEKMSLGGRERLVSNVGQNKEFRILAPGISSLINIQLVSKNEVVGDILCATCKRDLSFSPDDLRIMAIAFKQLTVALEKIDLIEQLREIDELRSQFFANVAHETKTPLTLIGNYLNQYIERVGTSAELQIIKQNIDKLQRDMVNFLDGEKLKRGQVFYKHNQILDLSDLLEKKIVLFREIAARKQITIESEVVDRIYIKADPYAIDRVINNLIDNAIKYTDHKGEVRVNLSLKKGKVRLVVSDTGFGISPDQQKHIFELYHQISHEKRNLQGIGLGLFIVKKIVESLKGDIHLHSKLGEGSTFEVELPLYRLTTADTVQLDIRYSKPMDVVPVDTRLEEMEFDPGLNTLLVVEDNINLLHFLQKSLARHYNIFFSLNGKHALKKLKKIPRPDVILSDVMMDEMDGYQLFEALSGDPRYRDIPFIFLSARASFSDRVRGLNEGAIDYIPKPFTIEELTAKINSILRNLTIRRTLFEMEKFASIGKLAAGISHEVFNPLSGIRVPLEYLMEKYDVQHDPDSEEAFSHIFTSIDRIEKIVKSLKVLYYKQDIERSAIRLRTVLDSVLLLVRKKIEDRIELIIEVDENLEVSGNHDAFTRIIINLVSNAIDAIDKTGRIQIRARREKQTIVLSVSDTGSGIPLEKLEHIFDLFYTTKEVGKGTGLGLYMVKDLVMKMGWQIDVESRPGKGTEFRLTMPVAAKKAGSKKRQKTNKHE